MLQKIKESATYIKSKVSIEPEVGIILGTGLGGLVDSIESAESINYQDIPYFPLSTVEGHSGRLIFGTLGGKKIVAMQGRFHFYEGYDMQQVTFPVRVMKFLNIKSLFVSNASGGMNKDFSIGDLMIINDHINCLPNPLVGKNIAELGPRFPDMSEPYNKNLIALCYDVSEKLAIKVHQGCYVGTTGPTFETPKEYGYFHRIGGDAVGMSTVPEVIVARHMNIPVFAMSIITDLGGDDIAMAVSHEEVQKEGKKAEKKMTRIMTEMLRNINFEELK
ncbi:MAG: purine-nucleoside phosphorylase [Bacteroidales bacterium]